MSGSPNTRTRARTISRTRAQPPSRRRPLQRAPHLKNPHLSQRTRTISIPHSILRAQASTPARQPEQSDGLRRAAHPRRRQAPTPPPPAAAAVVPAPAAPWTPLSVTTCYKRCSASCRPPRRRPRPSSPAVGSRSSGQTPRPLPSACRPRTMAFQGLCRRPLPPCCRTTRTSPP
jgi:serine/arginine repetitive matrix protein 1